MAEIYVTSSADSGAGSLRQAIADAQDGDVILFDADVFPFGQTTSILLASQLTINKIVSVYAGASDGNGGYTSGATRRHYVYRDVEGVKTKVYINNDNPAQDGETVLFENVCRVALDGQGAVRCVYSSSNDGAVLALVGVCLANGYSGSAPGGGLYAIYKSVNILIDCAINNCSNNYLGGGLFAYNESENTLSDCSIYDCNSNNGGAFYFRDTSQNALNNCVIDSCDATSTGGAFYSNNESNNRLVDCIFFNCTASNYGGAIYTAVDSRNSLSNCVIESCSATSNGGAVYSHGASQNIINDCLIIGCSCDNAGGCLHAASASINTMTDCHIKNCSSVTGGAIYGGSTAQTIMARCVFDSCSATNGGAIEFASFSISDVRDCVFSSCTATTNGGGLYLAATSDNTLTSCSFVNCAATNGAGAYVNNTVVNTIDSCNFDAASIVWCSNAAKLNIVGITKIASAKINSATVDIADGAALSLTGTATINAATFASEGRGYLATASGVNTSAATFNGVVVCDYGADVTAFSASGGVLSWDATDPTIGVLLEQQDGEDWTTLAERATSYTTRFPMKSAPVRLFDGEKFLTVDVGDYSCFWRITDWATFAASEKAWKANGWAVYLGGGDSDAYFSVKSWAIDPETSED